MNHKNNSLLNSLPLQGKEATSKQAFTLVELIVVITIIAILGTIAFISLQGYSANARDSTRISDLSTMKSSLELFQVDSGKYPSTDGFIVTYSGTEVWTQGTFGNTTKTSVKRLDKIPTDPLTEKEYTYSITKTKQEYQLSGIFEGDSLAYNFPHPNPLPSGEGIATIFQKANAGNSLVTAVVTGNYNGVLFKTSTGSNCEILSVPSIISAESQTDLLTILNNKSLVYNGKNNLPSNYINSKFKVDGGFDFQTNKLVVYSDTNECKTLYENTSTGITARTTLITNLQAAYTGTIIANSDSINNITNLDLTNTDNVTAFANNLVNNSLGGTLGTSNTSTTNTNNNNVVTIDTSSCKTILDNGGSVGDGVYSIDPDGVGGNSPFDVYCDMTTDGGGWTLLAMTRVGYTSSQGKDFNSEDLIAPTNLYSLTTPYFSKAIRNVGFSKVIFEQQGIRNMSNQYDLGNTYTSFYSKITNLTDNTGFLTPTAGRSGLAIGYPISRGTAYNTKKINFGVANYGNIYYPYCFAIWGNRRTADPRTYTNWSCGRSGIFINEYCIAAASNYKCGVLGNTARNLNTTEYNDIFRIWIK